MVSGGATGCGKTTVGTLAGQVTDAHFIPCRRYCRVKEIREAVQEAKQQAAQYSVHHLVVDEVHRFNKGQQDAIFNPYVEKMALLFL